jgi:hypothetical protein
LKDLVKMVKLRKSRLLQGVGEIDGFTEADEMFRGDLCNESDEAQQNKGETGGNP